MNSVTHASPPAPSAFQSKLPHVGTTVFSVMTALAQKHQAINLGQGFPDFDCHPDLLDAVTEAMRAGHNQYAPMAGLPILRQAVAHKIRTLYGPTLDWDQAITITAGATQAILTTVLATVGPGDEVIVLEPAYDSYLPAIALAGATAVPVPLSFQSEPPRFAVDWDRVHQALSPKTKLLILNSPHNPTGWCLQTEDLSALVDLSRRHSFLILSDEVYEHMVFDGQNHLSLCSQPELAARTMVVSSFGKTYHVTGWKVAYCVGPHWWMQEFRKVHQFNVFSVNTPMQSGLAAILSQPHHYLNLPQFYQAKRDLFRAGLAEQGWRFLPCPSTYFQTVDYSNFSNQPDGAFCEWLIEQMGVAAIPMSAFYSQPIQQGLIRFCFAKQDTTLLAALDRLAQIRSVQ